jgi:Asp-tRNA(Asn)/Glu-tRNA(Gln) amidotransferase A subunit family amidase
MKDDRRLPLHRRAFLGAGAAVTAAAAIGCRGGSVDPAAPGAATPPPGATTAAVPGPDAAAAAATGLTPADLAGAEKVALVGYTGEERAQILTQIDQMLAGVRARRDHAIALEDQPATRFDPVLGAPPAAGRGKVALPRLAAAALPADEIDIAFAPLPRLADWIRRRRITSARLTEIYLDRLTRHDPRLRCAITITADRAREQARRADAEIARGRYRGPLHGIPYGAKDLLDTAGIATTFGAEPYRDRVPAADAVVVTRLAAAGAVLAAKTSLGALAYGDRWLEARTRNPWNPAEGSSGSSAGSAAAVAAGLLGFAIGTETLGSIISPCHRCGATGLRPTFGRVPRTGAMPLCWSLDKIGPIARTAAGTALVLDAVHGAEPGDPDSRTVPFELRGGPRLGGVKIGFAPSWFEGKSTDPVDRAALEAARRAGASLVEIEMPALPYDALMTILYAESAAAFEDLTLSDQDDQLAWQDPEAWPNTFRASRFLTAIDLVQADRLRRQVMEAMARVFAGVDLLIAPAWSGPLLTVTNFTGHPAQVIRAGFAERKPADGAEGPPFSAPRAVVLYGRLFDEGRLLRAAMALESELAVADRRPPGFD